MSKNVQIELIERERETIGGRLASLKIDRKQRRNDNKTFKDICIISHLESGT